MYKTTTAHWLALLLSAFFVISACRLTDAVAQVAGRSPTAVAAVTVPASGAAGSAGSVGTPEATTTASSNTGSSTSTTSSEVGMLIQTISALQTQSWFPTAGPDEGDPSNGEEPTDDPALYGDETPEPNATVPTRTYVMPANAPTAEGDTTEDPSLTEEPTETDEATETPQPTPEFRYLVKNPYCGPNWKTFVEGTVTEGGEPVDGLLARISTNMGGDPAWTDYKTGTDPEKPGGYTQIIDANRPHEGLWYVWLVDPDTNRRISEIATIKTDRVRVEDTDKSPGSCQSATIDFSSNYAATPTEEPYVTEAPDASHTPSRTATRTRTGTPYTSTPTRTRTPGTGTPTSTWTPTITETPTDTLTPTITRTPTDLPTAIPPH